MTTWKERAKRAVEKNSGGTAPTKPTEGAFVSSVSPDPAPFSPTEGVREELEERRERVLALLRATTGKRLAVLVEDPDADPVSVAIALRNTNGFLSFEILIPREKYDGFALLELVDRHSKLAVIDGGKTHRVPGAA